MFCRVCVNDWSRYCTYLRFVLVNRLASAVSPINLRTNSACCCRLSFRRPENAVPRHVPFLPHGFTLLPTGQGRWRAWACWSAPGQLCSLRESCGSSRSCSGSRLPRSADDATSCVPDAAESVLHAESGSCYSRASRAAWNGELDKKKLLKVCFVYFFLHGGSRF